MRERAPIADGTVEVSWAFPASQETVWIAISDPLSLGRWLGAVTPPPIGGDVSKLKPGAMALLTCDNGDSFLLEVRTVAPPHALSYVWANMGMGVEETITWTLTPAGDNCLVSVTDADPQRTPDLLARRRHWWLQVLGQLDHFLREQTPLPPVSPRDIEARVEIPGSLEGLWGLLVEPGSQDRWLPLQSPFLERGAELELKDKDGHVAFGVSVVDVSVDRGRNRLTLALAAHDWLCPTHCEIELHRREETTMIVVRHEGWQGIAADVDVQRRCRRHFSMFWLVALRRFTAEYMRRKNIPTMSPAQVNERIGHRGFHVFDTNVPERWERGHVVGARHLGPDPVSPQDLPEDKDETLVFYCRGDYCRIADLSAGRAKALGYTNVFVMREGTEGWAAAGLPLETANPPETSSPSSG